MKSTAICCMIAAASLTGPALGQGTTPREQWWDDRVFYEIFVRSFADSTTGPLAGDGIGDIQGMIEKLDELNDGDPKTTNDLGITGIWLMPIHPSPSYHGYDITDYCAINPEFGTRKDFERFVAECHKRGIAVIIDLVINHTSDKHPWFIEAQDPASPRRDWYVWADKDPGWQGPWGQKVWHPAPSGSYFGLFYHGMPDLNFRSAALTGEVYSIVDFWSREMKVDGFRLDAIRHLIEEGQVQENTPATHAWLKGFGAHLRSTSARAMTIGEVWSSAKEISKYIGDELDLCFEFGLADTMMKAAGSANATHLREVEREVNSLYPRGQFGRFLTNHDQTRVMTMLRGDEGKARAAAALMLLGEGVPFIYYGEEIGMWGDKPDELIRTPMQWSAGAGGGFTAGTPWQALNKDAPTRNVERQRAAPSSLLNTYRELIALRSQHEALRRGGTTVLDSSEPSIYAFVRYAEGAPAALVMVNLGDRAISTFTLSCERSQLIGDWKSVTVFGAPAHEGTVTFADHGDLTDFAPGVQVPARGCVVMLLTRP